MARKTPANLPKPNASNLQGSSRSVGAHSEGTESYKSTPGGSDGSFTGIADTSAGTIPQLKRSTPEVGVYQSGNNNRGGQMTKNYDSSQVDGDPGKFDKNIRHGEGGGQGDTD